MPSISLGFEFKNGNRVSPETLHRLVEEATVSGFIPSDFGSGSIKFLTYGSSRPSLTRGTIHYDTTIGLEGLIYSWLSASNASVSGWLYATPRRECFCWSHSGASAGTPVFIGAPDNLIPGAEYVNFDGCLFPTVWQHTGASGPNAAMFLTLESVSANRPVKCMWAGIAPDPLNVLNSASGASAGSALFVDYAEPAAWKFGDPTPRNLVFGINTLPQAGRGAVIWGTGPTVEDIV